jgi:alginate O-acetyltransferase complex protein AlgI
MPELAVDLGAPTFWLFFAAALVLLLPVTSPTLKRWLFAGLNFGFVGSVLGYRGVTAAGALLLFVWGAGHSLRLRSRRTVTLVFAGLGVGALFLIHKLPPLGPLGGAGLEGKTILAGVGFSFVALRIVEFLKASVEAEHPFPPLVNLANYLFPFHMLAAGPIQSYDEYVAASPVGAPLTVSRALSATERITAGLFKKFVLAEGLKTVFLTGFAADGAYFLLEAQLFYLWVYLDFSAYSDIAVGIGQLLGIKTPENFDRPLAARNVIEFWERWHISLSQFIRRNLFVPLQLVFMRRFEGAKLATACAAFTISFLLCGAWHGFNVRCLGWGAIHAIGLSVCTVYKAGLTHRLGRKGVLAYMNDRTIRALSTFITFEFIAFSLVFIAYPFD